ncbi:hypothetical protein VP1G_05645 [Cytospora mali]|uniref:Mitotic checkpoint regulator, MAD2B-interacting-domain-containing protein n=1 Tax=Cytospora mali TaxID=578113 RepID=A0A194V365_CYTMA|nr:hypothetical protein VP1G_05645 [Valsa mali var. pyri (nom. inval.)]
MGLVDYSDSDSDSDSPGAPAPQKPATSQPAAKQQPFQKLVDTANPNKILVNLPSASSAKEDATHADDNPAKRRKIGAAGGGGGRFGGFSSFLPPPKATATSRPLGGSGAGKAAPPRVGVNLKTSSEAAFCRDSPSDFGDGKDDRATEEGNSSTGSSLGLRLPAPKASAQPSIPEEQKPEEEVKLVGKPLMFKPLSVARKPRKKAGGVKAATTAAPKAVDGQGAASGPSIPAVPAAQKEAPQAEAAPSKRKKVSLFTMTDDTPPSVEAAPEESASYEPEFTSYDNDSAFTDGYASYDAHQHQQQQQYTGYMQQQQPTNASADPNSLDSIADDLNLSAAARRELFGRDGPPSSSTAKSVINFNLDQEYRHNEELRSSGALDQQKHNPLRAIKPGKHSLQQLVNQVQSQRDALEENFAKNRSTQKSAGAKYGFR